MSARNTSGTPESVQGTNSLAPSSYSRRGDILRALNVCYSLASLLLSVSTSAAQGSDVGTFVVRRTQVESGEFGQQCISVLAESQNTLEAN